MPDIPNISLPAYRQILRLQDSVTNKIHQSATTPLELSWREFSNRLTTMPVRSDESFDEYWQWKLDKDSRCLARKSSNGYYIKGPLDQERYAAGGSGRMPSEIHILVMDFDLPSPSWEETLKEQFDYFAWVVHTTASHSTQKPKLRLVAPLKEPIGLFESKALTHLMFSRIGWWDGREESIRPNQPMFWPTLSRDQDWRTVNHDAEDKPWLDGMRELYDQFGEDDGYKDETDWAPIPEEFKKQAEAQAREQTAQHMRKLTGGGDNQLQSPFEKTGTVGAFTSTYSVEEMLAKYFPSEYEPGSTINRWTAVEGSNINGISLLDYYEELGGHSALINFHESDTTGFTGGRPVNVYDFIAMKLFPGQTEQAQAKKMRELCDQSEKLTLARIRSGGRRTSHAEHVLKPDQPPPSPPTTAAADPVAEAPPSELPALEEVIDYSETPGMYAHEEGHHLTRDEWLASNLETTMSDKASMLSSAKNWKLLTTYCREWNCFARDLFTGKVVCTNTIQLAHDRYVAGEEYKVSDLSADLLGHAETNFVSSGPCNLMSWDRRMKEWLMRDQDDAPHAFRDWLYQLPEWDGIPRCHGVLGMFLKAEDNIYNHTVSRMLYTGTVLRAMEPGCGWDYVPVLCGSAQGTGKSSLLRLMLPKREWFSDNFKWTDLHDSKKMVEEAGGIAIIELGEMYQFEKDQEANKQAISRRIDSARAAYGTEKSDRPRNFIICGTSNQSTFLTDASNRRYLPITVPKQSHFTDAEEEQLKAMRVQLFAEAFHYYCAGDSLETVAAEWRALQEGDSPRYKNMVNNWARPEDFFAMQLEQSKSFTTEEKDSFNSEIEDILKTKCATSDGIELCPMTCTREVFEHLHQVDKDRMSDGGTFVSSYWSTKEGRAEFRREARAITACIASMGYQKAGRISTMCAAGKLSEFARALKWERRLTG